jgi:gliding motility-associated-like protein
VVTEPDPGTNGTLSLCFSDAPAELFSSLGGTPDIGGTWTAPSGAAFTGTFDPSSDVVGVYTYTIDVPPPCSSVSSTVTVTTIQPPNAGIDAVIAQCITSGPLDLFAELGGTPDIGGTWTGPTGAVFNGPFIPGTSDPGQYTYTVAGNAPCPADQASATVTVVTEPDPGGDGFIALCNTDGPAELFNSLEGDPDQGGAWTAPDGSAFSGTFDPATAAAGVYTYTIAVPPPCNSVSSTVTVQTVAPPNAGSNGSVSLCISGGATDLFPILGGSPEQGGSWTDPAGAPSGGSFQPGADATGNYTYTVAGNTPCPAATAIVTVGTVNDVFAGNSGILNLCATGDPIDLFPSLGGADLNGTWTAPGGSAFTGTFVPGTDLPGAYTYTVLGTAPCTNDNAVITVNVLVDAYAGVDGTTTLCGDNAPVDLFAVLSNGPNPGGNWIAPNGTATSGTFDPVTNAPGTYTYVVAVPLPCLNDTAQVQVAVVAPVDAGLDASIERCSNDDAFDLFGQLGGTPQTGGVWSGPGGSSASTFTPGTSTPGNYTYTMLGTAPCPDQSAVVTVSVSQAPYAGENGAITLCTTDATEVLFESLEGSPNTNGTWTAPGGQPFSGTFDPATDAAGTYTYTITVPPPCVSVSSTVLVSTVQPPFAGMDAILPLCASSPSTPLFPSLGAGAQNGGTWTAPGGGIFGGSFDPALHTAGGYTYTVEGVTPCPADAATISVTVEPLPDPGTNGSATVCPEAAPVQLFDLLGGTPQTGGTWTGPGGAPSNGVFDPASDPQGVYTYTVAAAAVCPDLSSSATVAIFIVSTPNAGPDAVTCDLSYNLNATGNWSTGVWSGPAGVTFADPTAANSTVTSTSGGPFTLTWTVVSTDGCGAEDSVTIIFTEAIVPLVKPIDAVCYAACDGTASVTAIGGNTDQNGYSYQWSAGTVGAGGSSVSGLCAGDYTVIVADMNGCTEQASFTIGQPVPLVIDLLNATPETCPGSCDGTIVVVDPEGSQYSINGGAFQPAPRFGDLCAGTYTITMLDGNGCSASAIDSVGTPAPVIAGFDFTPETLFVTNTLADFVNTSTVNAVDFSWDFAGIGTSTEASPSFTFPGGLGAEYTVCLTASDVNGCSDEYCRVVTILDVLVVYVPNTFTPDNDGINDAFVPIFNVPWVEDYEFLIFDRWGERIFESFTPGEAWDGSMRGELVETEVYVWKLYCRDQLTNERISRVGHVTVLK